MVLAFYLIYVMTLMDIAQSEQWDIAQSEQWE